MATYDFTLILSSPSELMEEMAKKLFAAGCDDGTLSSCEGLLLIDFSRESSDLETSIRSAIADAVTAGCVVDRVQILAKEVT
ncbi:MAG TPA: hypothetical protein VFE46_16870 [Pirellulales bacterium]|jgi:hypothetical protein|nr:hypothetical protein [Pirellulales bacterium]